MKVECAALENQVVSVKVDGRLDAATVSVLEEALAQLLAEKQCRLVINLFDASYISSSGLRVLLTARRQARALGGDVVTCCMSARVRQVFDMIGFSSLFGEYDGEDQAAGALVARLAKARK